MKRLYFKLLLCFVIFPGLWSCSDNTPPKFINDIDTRPSLRFMTFGNTLYAAGGNHLNVFDITDVTSTKLDKYLVEGSSIIDLCADSFLISSAVPQSTNYYNYIPSTINVYSVGDASNPALLHTNGGYNYGLQAFAISNNVIYAIAKGGSKSSLMMSYIDPISGTYKSVNQTADSLNAPVGITCSDKNVFVAEPGKLKIYDIVQKYATPVFNQSISKNIEMISFQNGILLILGDGYISQYSYTANTLSLLSKIPVNK